MIIRLLDYLWIAIFKNFPEFLGFHSKAPGSPQAPGRSPVNRPLGDFFPSLDPEVPKFPTRGNSTHPENFRTAHQVDDSSGIGARLEAPRYSHDCFDGSHT
jgi:hypothetical protein